MATENVKDVADITRRMDGHSFVGVAADLSRGSGINDLTCKSCCVFGIDEEEFNTLKAIPESMIAPSTFDESAARFVVKLNPWLVMRVLGEQHGHILPQQPLIAQSKMAESKMVLVFTIAKEQRDKTLK